MKRLDQIISIKKQELSELKKAKSLEQIRREVFELEKNYKSRDFFAIFADRDSVKLIAEIKLVSPSHGRLTSISYIDLAKIYAQSPADAISVLTEKRFFGGNLSFIKEVKGIISQPILRKDFIVDEYQIYETYLARADAFLLIASILSKKQLAEFLALGKSLNLSSLVEVHTNGDLTKALSSGAEIIGINNRDLTTMKTDLTTTERLVGLIPSGKVIISESGINSTDDVRRLEKVGINGILVGTSIVTAPDPLKKIKELKNL